jgi:Lipocalin-like domain
MKSGRKSAITDPSAVARGTEDELLQIADGCVGYFGSFDVDGSTVTHHIEACTLPAWPGPNIRN